MSVKIVASSPIATEMAKDPDSVVKSRNVYPFEDLAVGQSFTIPLAEAKVASLKVIASRKSKDGKRFVVIEHEKQTPPLVEVARIQ